MNIQQLTIALAASAACFCAQAANSINLANYQVTGTYGLSTLAGSSNGVSGLEASAVTYARDRGTLFYVGDEGTGVVEISLTGQTLGTMAFNWANTGSSKHDTEGLAYLGNGVLVVTEERLYDAYRFNYVAGGSANLASSSVSISNATVGNEGLEGISHDPREYSKPEPCANGVNVLLQIVLDLVDREAITSQEQLRRRLHGRGVAVTQATLSRDIKELGLVKRAADGAYSRPGPGTGIGRGWPLLTGERGHYELEAGNDPLPYLAAMAAMASPGGMIPEQIWDAAPLPGRRLR